MPLGNVPDGDPRNDPGSRRADGFIVEAEGSSRPWQADAHVHHAARLLQFLSVADHLGWQPADGDSLLPAPPKPRLGIRRAVPGGVPLCGAVRAAVVAIP